MGRRLMKKKMGRMQKNEVPQLRKQLEREKKNKGNWTKFHLKIDNKLLDGLDKLVKIGGAKSRDDAILTAVRQYLIQLRMLVD